MQAAKDDDNRRIDRILRRYLSSASLPQLYKSVRSGLIKLNGKKCEANTRVFQGDTISIASFLCTAPGAASTQIQEKTLSSAVKPLSASTILFRNEHILILNKPYDVPVQPASRHDRESALSTAVKNDFIYHTNCLVRNENHAIEDQSRTPSVNSNSSLSFTPGPLHRLDRKTTGALCFSQSLQGAHWFSQAMQAHRIKKYYIALVSGMLQERQLWTDTLFKEEAQKRTFKTVSIVRNAPQSDHAPLTKKAKEAITEVTPLAFGSYKNKRVTLVQCAIQTGRTHQIRLQCASHGYPLIGDTAYGAERLTGAGQDFFLHAYELHFPENSCALPPIIRAPIMTFFEKMLSKTLIKWDGRLIV